MNEAQLLTHFHSMSDAELDAVEYPTDVRELGAVMMVKIERHAKVCQDIEECTWNPFPPS